MNKNYNFLLSGEDSEFIPILPINENDTGLDKIQLADTLPILPLRNTVLFPGILLPITISREQSLSAINEAYSGNKIIGALAQKKSSIDNPGLNDLEKVGTIASIVKLIKMPDGNTTVIIQGRQRFELTGITEEKPFLKGTFQLLEDDAMPLNDKDFDAYISNIKDLCGQIIELSPGMPSEASVMLKNIESPFFLVNFACSNLVNGVSEKQEILEISTIRKRTEQLIKVLQIQLQFAELKNKVTNKTRAEIDKQQKEYFLQQQLKSIKDELGGEGNDREILDLKKKAEKKKWPQQAHDLFNTEIEKLGRMNSSTPDYSVTYNHLELMLALPWNECTEDNYNLKDAKAVLDKDHYGMQKIKNRILEYLAVLKLKGDMKSPILCFVGPPGIGKTSLGKSIAHAMSRKYIRVSLGGLHDESEIRGHRKTYIGAMPGRIIQSLKKAQTSNPVMILDEIDKMGNDYRGNPESAMLEVLDPEQNNTFYDNYLELEYDLSKVLFIATANNIQNIEPALRDRLEIIDLSGYAIEEKIEIAKQHLIPKEKEAHGLKTIKLKLKDQVIEKIIEDYTRESGVRELDRQIAAIMRYEAKEYTINGKIKSIINIKDLPIMLGHPRYSNDLYKVSTMPGVAVGLAWTILGGDILFIESVLSLGKGEMQLTGNLGQVMKESATTAMTYLKAHAEKYGINIDSFAKHTIHIHVPEGAVPKDGPSAGITMLTALTSAFTGKRVRPYLTMTGEITLRGQVLPVGGIREKILAAKRSGLKEVILCEENKRDVEDIEQEYIKGLTFHYVKNCDQVISLALENK